MKRFHVHVSAATELTALAEEMGTTCCDAESDKNWVKDPQGVASETFH